MTENKSSGPDQVIDLDHFLNLRPDDQSQQTGQAGPLPEMDRVTVVGIFADDSGSMSHLRTAVLDGLALAVTAFKGAKGSDFYLDVRGFNGKLFRGPLGEVQGDSFNEYKPNYDETPLITHATAHLRDLHERAKQYRVAGIPTTVALLVMTDGEVNGEARSPESFASVVEPGDYVVGMGITSRGDDAAARTYGELFRGMAVTKTVTPNASAAEVRHAINQFSQSVASIAAA